MSARMRVEGGVEGGGNYNVQHGAAPITNEMYNKVKALSGNSNFDNTGAPVSIQFDVEGVLYQNFEYGYVKVEAGVATFHEDLVVDSKGTEMNRRIGTGEGFNNWLNRPTEYYLAWERLRVGQNFREMIGQMIRDGDNPYITTDDPLGDSEFIMFLMI